MNQEKMRVFDQLPIRYVGVELTWLIAKEANPSSLDGEFVKRAAEQSKTLGDFFNVTGRVAFREAFYEYLSKLDGVMSSLEATVRDLNLT
ncbi:hypothetical protein FWC63_01115 [Candidatus Saccharibacteria bacterium]|nr:hypothetical protein [Candidatus Saccharibacteria bacterium]